MKKTSTLLLCSILLGSFSFYTHAQIITTVAGTGAAGYTADNIAASGSELNNPFGIAAGAGNLYIADRTNNRIRKVDNAGIITTIAGNGTSGFSGDGGPATNAAVADPVDVAVDSHGNVYIADKSNNRIRKVDVSGNITTIAGTVTSGFSGDGGPATIAELANPRGLAVDSHGNVYISDQGNNRVRRVDNAGIITTIAGTATTGYNGDGIAATAAQLNGPYGIAVDGLGNVYICDVDNERIRKIDATGIITTIAGNGTGGYNGDGITAISAELSEPIGIAVDGSGNVYIADGWNSRIRAVGSSGLIYTLAGNGVAGYGGDGGPAMAAQLNDPYGVAVDASGNIYMADYANNRIRYMTRPTGVPVLAGSSFDMKIVPNPCQGRVSVTVNSRYDEQVQIIISNLFGEKISSGSATTNQASEIRLNEPPGCYFLNVFTTHGALSEKIIVTP